jgi:hypothetical protein
VVNETASTRGGVGLDTQTCRPLPQDRGELYTNVGTMPGTEVDVLPVPGNVFERHGLYAELAAG